VQSGLNLVFTVEDLHNCPFFPDNMVDKETLMMKLFDIKIILTHLILMVSTICKASFSVVDKLI